MTYESDDISKQGYTRIAFCNASQRAETYCNDGFYYDSLGRAHFVAR